MPCASARSTPAASTLLILTTLLRAEATRAELRALLYDLSDQLLSSGHGWHVLLDGVRHALALAELASIPPGVLRTVLRNLQRDLVQHPASVDRHYFAAQLTTAADHL